MPAQKSPARSISERRGFGSLLLDLGAAALITGSFSSLNVYFEQTEQQKRELCTLAANLVGDESLNPALATIPNEGRGQINPLKQAGGKPIVLGQAEQKLVACLKG